MANLFLRDYEATQDVVRVGIRLLRLLKLLRLSRLLRLLRLLRLSRLLRLLRLLRRRIRRRGGAPFFTHTLSRVHSVSGSYLVQKSTLSYTHAQGTSVGCVVTNDACISCIYSVVGAYRETPNRTGLMFQRCWVAIPPRLRRGGGSIENTFKSSIFERFRGTRARGYVTCLVLFILFFVLVWRYALPSTSTMELLDTPDPNYICRSDYECRSDYDWLNPFGARKAFPPYTISK